MQCVAFVLKGSAGLGGGGVPRRFLCRKGEGGRAQLLLGGGISSILLVLFMLASFGSARFGHIVTERAVVVEQQRFFLLFFLHSSERLFNGDFQVCPTLYLLCEVKITGRV